jgi:hypothetical protein
MMYSRRITSPDQVISHIDVVQLEDSDANGFRNTFLLWMGRYLRGVGHPEGMDEDLISAEMRDRDAGNQTLRAERFLVLCMASELLPTDPDWKISVRHI